ncbi:MAG: tetratricopeptide repeat protein [Acidobacteria bacterium]|nr:tetratricopeptide repeat protein [Acidobacteriota bacterium]
MRIGALFLVAALPLSTQFWSELANPKVDAVLTHPPGLGLKIDRVAFLPGRDINSRELADQLTASIVQSRAMEVVDRSHLDAVLKEQELGAGGYVDPATIASLGKLLGPTALVIVNVNRCDFAKNQATREERYKDKQGVEHVRVEKKSITALDFTAAVQVVDLATGKIFGAQRIEENPSRFATSYDGWPAYPREAEVRHEAFERAQLRISRMLLPWTETRRLTFFDDKEFSMEAAHARVQARDYRGALELSLKGLEDSKRDTSRKPKYYPRAWYNVGIIHFIRGDYEEARPFLQKALDMQPDASIFKSAYQDCLDALDLQAQLRKSEERSVTAARPATPAKATAAAASPAPEGRPSPEERLKKLQDLYRKGLLDKKEFEAKKAEILKEL